MKILTAALMTAAMALPASATTLRITVTNTQLAPTEGEAGFALAPVYSAFHDGSFDPVTVGERVTAGVETLAELGNPAAVRAERIAALPASTGAPVSSGALIGGASSSVEVEITDFLSQRYFSFLSMVLPSNDLFIANATATAYNLFNDDGTFVGPRTISVTGLDVFDAGTEENNADVSGGAAFVAGAAAPDGVDTDDVATAGFSALEAFLGAETPAGFSISPDLVPAGFFADASNAGLFSIASITIEEVVAPVPLPAGGVLLLSALGVAGVSSARRKAKKQA